MPSSRTDTPQHCDHARTPPVMIVSTHGQKTPVDLIRRKSLDALDYSDVRSAVVAHTTFPLAEELASAIAPSTRVGGRGASARDPRRRCLPRRVRRPRPQRECRRHRGRQPRQSRRYPDWQGAARSADSLEVLGRARTAFARNTASAPVLAEIASGIPDLLEVQRQVRSKIGIRGEVLDSATPTLGALRRSVRTSYQRAVEALERVMRSPVGEDALQDQVISVRSDRLVLQVRTELRPQDPRHRPRRIQDRRHALHRALRHRRCLQHMA